MQGKVALLRPAQQIELPVFGHLAMQVHRGYKVFDFAQSEVTKVFAKDASTHFAKREMEASIQASSVSAAPRHLGVGSNKRWYKEEYVCGIHATRIVAGQKSDYLRYYPEVEKCQLELIGCSSPLQVETVAQLDRLGAHSFRSSWSAAGIDPGKIDFITEYVSGLHKWLVEHTEQRNLHLVQSHGDFSLVNAISTDSGLRFIDWEGLGPGSLFSDIYNFVFVERYYGRSSPDFVTEISDFIERYRNAVVALYPELSASATLKSNFARRLYYLERLKLMLDRDISTNLCDVVCKSIRMFDEFDDEADDKLL